MFLSARKNALPPNDVGADQCWPSRPPPLGFFFLTSKLKFDENMLKDFNIFEKYQPQIQWSLGIISNCLQHCG